MSNKALKNAQLIVLGCKSNTNIILSQKILQEYPKAIIDLTLPDRDTLWEVYNDVKYHLTNVIFVLMPNFTIEESLAQFKFKNNVSPLDMISFNDLNLS